MLEKSSMNTLSAEMHDAMLVLGKPVYGEKQARWLPRAARSAGISFRTARALFQRERHDPRASVVEAVRKAVRRARGEKEAQEARREHAAILDRIARLEAAMGLSDAEFFGPERHALRGLAGRENSALDT